MASLLLAVIFTFVLHCQNTQASLRTDYYAKTCPPLEKRVLEGMIKVTKQDSRAPASLLRMHFHDCFVRGCDASILLDVPNGEKSAGPNINSLRGFEYIDQIKADLESVCPGVVSCADILALVARDSVVLTGGTGWKVPLGRRDGLVSIATEASANLPAPTFNISQLIASFQKVGLEEEDMITLSGAHTIGFAKCSSFSSRLNNFGGTGKADPSIRPSFLKSLKQLCPQGGNGETLSSLDVVSETKFDNQYYLNLMGGRGLLNSDQVLFTTFGKPRNFVKAYSNSNTKFLQNFAGAMIKMGNISPLLFPNGQIRKNCRKTN